MEPDEPYDPREELLEHAAEAMEIINADDKLQAAFGEVLRAKLEAKTIGKLYDACRAEMNAHKRLAAKWEAKARKAALCSACRVALERDE